MSLKELLASGITFQGDTVVVKYWNSLLSVLGGSQVIAEAHRQLYLDDVDERYHNKEVLYVYQENHTLVVEVGD